jgi:LmbE family N-acetylglucosaminyl deacetylase
MPAAEDGHPDHEATTRCVSSAANQTGNWVINEYPVWRWNQYPFVMEKDCGLRCKVRQIKSFIRYFLLDQTVKVSVSTQLERKVLALNMHVSQMTRKYADQNITLKQIGQGEWLAALLTDYEIFKR